MNRWVTLGVVLCLLPAGRAGAQAEPRRPRPPPDYSSRVNLHETPISVAPPIPEARPEDTLPPGALNAAPPELGRPAPLSVQPAPRPDLAPDRGALNRSRDARTGQPDASTPSGWGWLADEVATNRAKRIAADQRAAREAAAEEADPYAEFIDEMIAPVTNQERSAQSTRARPDAERGAQERPTFQPVLGWGSDWGDGSASLVDLTAVTAARDVEERAARSREREESAPPAQRLIAPNAPVYQEHAREEPVDEREERNASRGFKGAEASGLWDTRAASTAGTEPGRMPASAFGEPAVAGTTFSPFEIRPAESLSLAPVAVPPVAAPTAESPSMSLGGMGSESERAAPKTLPW